MSVNNGAPGEPATLARVMTMEEAAAYLNVRTRYVRRLVEERRITFVKVGRFVRFDPADLDAFLTAGRIDAHGVA